MEFIKVIYHELEAVVYRFQDFLKSTWDLVCERTGWVQAHPSPVKRILKNLNKIQDWRFAAVYSPNMSIYTVRSLYCCIDEYTQLLCIAVNVLRNSQDIPVTLFASEIKMMLLPDFFLDKDRCYIDPVDAGRRFKQASRDFLYWYAIKEASIENTTDIRNTRILQHVVANLLIITEQLRRL